MSHRNGPGSGYVGHAGKRRTPLTGLVEARREKVTDGSHTLDAQATDSDANTSAASISVTTENTDDPPSASWINPKDGDTVSGSVEVRIAAGDDRYSGADLTVEWEINNSGTWQTAAYDSTCGCYVDTWDTTAVSDADHNLDARATDTSGNVSAEARITVTVNNSGGGSGDMYVWEQSWSEKHRGPGGSFTDLSVTVDVNRDSDGDYRAEVTELTHDTLAWNSALDADNPDWYCGVPNGGEC